MNHRARHPLRHVADVSVSNVDKVTTEGDIPVRLVNYTDVYYGDRLTPNSDLMAATATRRQVETFRLIPDDVVITKDSETADDVGVAAFVESSAADMVLGYHLALLRPRPSLLDGRYLFWAMCSDDVRGQLATGATGVTRFGLRTDAIRSAALAVPAVSKQRAIANFLDTETTRIDAVIATKRRLAALLEERSRSEIDAALGIRLSWSPAGVPVPMHDGQSIVRLGAIAQVQSGLTLDSARAVSPDVELLPYLRVANVQDGSIDLTEVKEVRVPPRLAARSSLRPGDVLMTEGGDPDKLGRGAVWSGQVSPCLHQNHIFAVRPGYILRSDYLALLTRSSYARAYFEATASKTTGIASTSTAKISSFRIPLPSTDNQAGIVEQWRTTNQRLKEVVDILSQQIALLREHRQALITAAVTGELEVPGMAA